MKLKDLLRDSVYSDYELDAIYDAKQEASNWQGAMFEAGTLANRVKIHLEGVPSSTPISKKVKAEFTKLLRESKAHEKNVQKFNDLMRKL